MRWCILDRIGYERDVLEPSCCWSRLSNSIGTRRLQSLGWNGALLALGLCPTSSEESMVDLSGYTPGEGCVGPELQTGDQLPSLVLAWSV